MKKLIILILAVILLVSCERLDPLPEIPEVSETSPNTEKPINKDDRDPEISVSEVMPPIFFSEEEFADYVREEFGTDDLDVILRYYRLKTLPPETEFGFITGSGSTFIMYNTNRIDIDGESEWMSISTSPEVYDIETGMIWSNRDYYDDSFIREIDGIKYYIYKALREKHMWFIRWHYEDVSLHAQFPARFTIDEVLAYVSDLERVDIVVE